MAKNNLAGSFFDTSSSDSDVPANQDQEALEALNAIPYADEDDDNDEPDEEDDTEDVVPEPKRKESKSKEDPKPKAKSKKEIVEEEEEDEDEDDEPEDEDDDNDSSNDSDEDDEDEPSIYTQTALDLIDEGVLVPVEGKDYKDSAIGLAELVEDTAEARLKARIKPGYESILEAMELGLDPTEWLENIQGVPYDQADLDDPEVQEYLVAKNLKNQGFSEEQIAKKITRYKRDETLADEAEEAQTALIKSEEKEKAVYAKQLEAQVQEQKRKSKETAERIRKQVFETKEVAGSFLTKEKQKELFDYINKPVTPQGHTQYMLDRNDPEKMITAAYLTMIGADSDKLTKLAKSKAAKAIKKELTTKSDKVSSGKGRAPREHITVNKLPTGGFWDNGEITIED